MQLVIVESPAKAKTINKYLGSDYKVLASFGHIRDLPSKDGSVLPDEEFKMLYTVGKDSEKHVKEIEKAVKQSDRVYLATDPDREGEAISWHIVEALEERGALKKHRPDFSRIVFHEITKSAVQKAIQAPREVNMDLVDSQQTRRALDYLVGFNLSPILWRKLPGSRSAGRVQSVALRLVCERESDIDKFISREYWTIKAVFTTEAGEYTAKLAKFSGNKVEQFSFENEEAANAALDSLRGLDYSVSDVQKKRVQRHPKPPFTTSTLQQEAARKLGFGAKRTMMVAQKLYEGFDIGGETAGLITYMRTDAVTLSKEAVTEARDVIGRSYGKEYLPEKPRAYKTKAKNAQEAHEAVRPTSISRTPQQMRQYLDKDHLALYELIWKRTVASQMASAQLDQTAILTDDASGNIQFRATGSVIAFDGFYKLYIEGKDDETDEEGGLLPDVKAGDAADMKQADGEQHFTQPPPRYTEASLVKKLEELGIGRPSTYASIISVLQDRNYVRLENKRFIAEERGRLVTAFLEKYFARYVEYDFTAKLEESLDDIADGNSERLKVLSSFWNEFKGTVDEAAKLKITDILDEMNAAMAGHLFDKDENGEPIRECPTCKEGELSLKVGRYGAFLGCSRYPECKYTKQIGQEDENAEAAGEFPKELCVDPDTEKTVWLMKGPYGVYLQLGDTPEDKKKDGAPKRFSLPKGVDPFSVTPEQALNYLSLPRDVGEHPETGKMIQAGIGRFGPYLKYDGKFVSLKSDDVLTVGMNRAVAVIAEYQAKGGGGKVLGKHPNGDELKLMSGRYGPYIKFGKKNVKIPKDAEPDAITLEEAIKLADAAPEKATKKKAAPKKTAAKKAAPKKKASGA